MRAISLHPSQNNNLKLVYLVKKSSLLSFSYECILQGMKKPYSHFDLPTQHLGMEHYIPPRTRDEDEAERRRYLPRGTVLAEQQRNGLYVAQAIMNQELDEPDELFASRVLAASGLNSSWYSYARNARVMRRRLFLPKLIDEEAAWRETHDGLRAKVRDGLAEAVKWGEVLAWATAESTVRTHLPVVAGRAMGNASLQLSCMTIGDVPRGVGTFDVQAVAREQGLASLEFARRAEAEMGVAPSIAQLADKDSPLSVYWRRNAPNGAYEALEQATQA